MAMPQLQMLEQQALLTIDGISIIRMRNNPHALPI
jgi:hypothetical protein